MQQVREKQLNLHVAYYDYKKAYNMVRHDWILRVFNWMGVLKGLIAVLSKIMGNWKTKLEIYCDGEKKSSRLINIIKGFLQGDSYAAVGFFCMKYLL